MKNVFAIEMQAVDDAGHLVKFGRRRSVCREEHSKW
jgi:hypothetical protein